ncbi:MAG: septation protein SepH, partial [Rhodoluna sp.]
MDDIRLFDTDGDYLVLEAQDGQKYRLLIDDSIRSSVKREQIQQLDTITITPREIQDEIRSGATIEDLVRRSGAPFEYIEKFAAPVIDELSHIVELALSIRLTIAGDRYSDTNQIEFGEIIGNRLATSGAQGITWRAQRAEFGTWHVTAIYRINDGEGSAVWSFDPRRLALSPESETAVVLSSQEKLNDSPIPKLRTVDSPAAQPAETASEVKTSTETVSLDDVIPISRAQTVDTPIAVEPPVHPTIASVPAAFANRESDPSQPRVETEEPLSATADLLDALRRKRIEREDLKLDAHPSTENIRVIDIEPPVSAPVLNE